MPSKDIDTHAIANRFLIVMKALGFDNQREMALAMGYDRPDNLYNATNGQRMPGIPLLIDVSNRFEKVNIDWILTGKGEMLYDTRLILNEDASGYGQKKSGNIVPESFARILNDELTTAKTSLEKLSQAISALLDLGPGQVGPYEDLPLGRKEKSNSKNVVSRRKDT